MPDQREPAWKVFRRSTGIVIRGYVTHPDIQKPSLRRCLAADSESIAFAVRLDPLGSYWSEEITTAIEHFEPDVPPNLRCVEIILPGCVRVLIEQSRKPEAS